MYVYTHRQLLVSTLIREVSLSSEQWWTWIHGCTKHREKVMGKGSDLNKSIYMKHSKPQGTLQKRGQKNVRSKTGRREKGRWTRQGPCNLSRTPHPAPMQHLICIRTGLSMVKCGCRQSLGGLSLTAEIFEPIDSRWGRIIAFSMYSLMTLPGSSRQSQPNDHTNDPS